MKSWHSSCLGIFELQKQMKQKQLKQKQMKKTIKLVCMASIIAIAAISCTTKQYVPFAHTTNIKGSKVYIFRPSIYGWAAGIKVYNDDKYIGKTKGKGYLCFEANEGAHIIVSKAEDRSSTPIVTQAGKSYYIIQTPEPGILRARVRNYEITESEGKRLMNINLKEPIIKVKK
ncbi:MAG: DUF2846 domain-containing protein [Bacteroidia bacterium]|nr:DUF2846 domain-containing protein [Bacteroidia bacterium]